MPDDKPPILEDLIALEQDARALGFTWPDHAMIHQQLVSECEEVKQAIANKEGHARIQEELGDVLHTAISWCLYAGYDVHETLAQTTHKFDQRMQALKRAAKARGLSHLAGQPLDVLLALWDEAKKDTDPATS